MCVIMSAQAIEKTLKSFAHYSGHAAAWLFIPLVLLTTAIALLRYGFNFGDIAAQEAITYLHAFIITLGVGYTWRKDGHVRVDILYKKRSHKTRLLINLAGDLLLLMPVWLGVLLVSWEYAGTAWASLEGSREAGGLPLVFILKSLIPAMAGLLLLQAVGNIIGHILKLKSL